MKQLLDLGCGNNKFKSEEYHVVGVDLYNCDEADMTFDLTKPWKLQSDQFDVLRASHTLEHFADIVPIMNEAYKVLKPGGQFWIIAPHFSSYVAWGNPTHYRPFSKGCFGYFDKTKPEHYGECNFKVISERIAFLNPSENGAFKKWFGWTAPIIERIAKRYPMFTERFLCKIIPFYEVQIKLEAVK